MPLILRLETVVKTGVAELKVDSEKNREGKKEDRGETTPIK